MATRKRTIEIDEDLLTPKEVVSVRLQPGDEPYAIWDCPTSPNEKIRVNDSTVLRFRNGNLHCRDASDDAAVENANRYAGGRYLRADPAFGETVYEQEKPKRTTRWHSKAAYERYVALNPPTS